jgi:ribosomal protein S18 acetylase RimI-like enzyme
MTKQEMIAIAHKGLLLGPSPLLRHYPAGRRAEREGVVLTCWGSFGAALNKVAVVRPAPPLARIRQLADEFFGPDSGGFGIVVEADADHAVEAELCAAGWEVFEDEPALVLPFIPTAPPLPAGLEVRPIRDAEGRRDLVRVCAEGFGAPTAEGGTELPPDAFDSLAPSLACARDPEVALLVGYLDRKPVASAELFMVGPIAGITGVATVPAYRRRGLGTALTWEALREGAARGCTCATLGALGASFDLYRKMGFIHVCNHRAYRPLPNPAARHPLVGHS